MTIRHAEPYSYRDDPGVPAFDDGKPLIVFDAVCVLCGGFAKFVLRHDRRGLFNLASAQSGLGQGLYRHYGLDPENYETNLVLIDGRVFGKMDAVIEVAARLGWPWRAAFLLKALPRPLADWLYDRVATNRYQLFGKRETCMTPPPGYAERFLG